MDGKYAALCCEDLVAIISLSNSKLVGSLIEHGAQPQAVSFSDDDEFIVSGFDNGVLCVWKMPSLKLVERKKLANRGIETLSVNGSRCAVGFGHDCYSIDDFWYPIETLTVYELEYPNEMRAS